MKTRWKRNRRETFGHSSGQQQTFKSCFEHIDRLCGFVEKHRKSASMNSTSKTFSNFETYFAVVPMSKKVLKDLTPLNSLKRQVLLKPSPGS